MYKHFLFAALTALTLTACGGAKTGEGYTSGVCKKDIVEAYQEVGQECGRAQYGDQAGLKKCQGEIEAFLDKYPDAGCEVTAGGDARFGSVKIDHQQLRFALNAIKNAGQMQR